MALYSRKRMMICDLKESTTLGLWHLQTKIPSQVEDLDISAGQEKLNQYSSILDVGL